MKPISLNPKRVRIKLTAIISRLEPLSTWFRIRNDIFVRIHKLLRKLRPKNVRLNKTKQRKQFIEVILNGRSGQQNAMNNAELQQQIINILWLKNVKCCKNRLQKHLNLSLRRLTDAPSYTHPINFITSPKMISKHEDSVKRANKFPLPKNSKYMVVTWHPL